MKNFEEFLIESLQSSVFLNYKNINVIDTKHSIDRKNQRKSLHKINWFFKKIIDWLLEHDKTDLSNDNFYGFFSKSLNVGCIISYRQDEFKRPGFETNKSIVIITWIGDLEKIKKTIDSFGMKPGTEKVVLESIELNQVVIFD